MENFSDSKTNDSREKWGICIEAYYCSQTKLGEGNVFTPVCDSVHRDRGVSQHAIGRGVGGTHP